MQRYAPMKNFLTKNSWILLVFVAVLGLVGPASVAANRAIQLLVILLFGVLYRGEMRAWYKEHAASRLYIKALFLFALYGLVLTAVWSLLPNPGGLRASYRDVEELLLAYVVMPLFCVAMSVGLSQKNFERAMLLFGVSTALGGVWLLCAYFDVSALFKTPTAFLNNVLSCRLFGCGTKHEWLSVFLKDYSFYPSLGALVLVPFFVNGRGAKRILAALFFAVNVLFLFLTINRGTMLSFGLALLLTVAYFLRRLRSWQKVGWALCLVLAAVLLVYMLPQSVKLRFAEIFTEGEAFFASGHDTGSVSTRLKIWEVLLSHVKEFWLFGDGPIYANSQLQQYLIEAGYQRYVDQGFIYHNQYLAYFHHYGVLGLLFMLFLLFYPLYASIRKNSYSVTLAAIVILFAVAQMEDRYIGADKVAMLMFFVYFSFFHVDKWRAVEKNIAEGQVVKV